MEGEEIITNIVQLIRIKEDFLSQKRFGTDTVKIRMSNQEIN